MKYHQFALLCLVAAGCYQSSVPISQPVSPDVTANKPELPIDAADRVDNPEVTQQDGDQKSKAPINQNLNVADAEITAKIWQRLRNSDLSTDAHNCKINVEDGYVTLRGRVQSDDEKNQIEKIAIEAAGAEKVNNQLEIER